MSRFLELLMVAAVVVWTLTVGVEITLDHALSAANAREDPTVRDVTDVHAAAGRASLSWLGGIAALALGRLAVGRRRHDIAVHSVLPTITVMTAAGLLLHWGYGDPLRARLLTAPGFAQGVLLGGTIACLAAVVPWQPDRWARRLTGPLVVMAIAALAVLWIKGEAPGGSGAKISFYGVQPIEGVKLAFVIVLAMVLGGKAEQLRYQRARRGPFHVPRPRLLLPAVALLAVLFVGLFLVRDLGPTLILSLVFLGFYYVATRSWVELALVTAALVLMVAWLASDAPGFVPPNVATRIDMWLDPWLNGRGGGDQLAAALWAFAAGGVGGRGLGQAAVGVLPAGHTDLVLAHWAEVAGLAGLALYGACFIALVLQGLWIAYANRTPERMLLACGLSLLLLAQGMVIFAGSTGLLPLTGVVVPFLSFGKSSMVTFLLLVAVLLRLAVDGQPRADRDELRQLRGGIGWVMAATMVAAIGALVVGADRTVLTRDATLLRPVLAMGSDDTVFLRYDPRMRAIARRLIRGDILDRDGRPLAATDKDGRRRYPLGSALGTLLGPLNPAVQTPPWAIEGLADEHLRGLPPATRTLAVWIEQHPDETDDRGEHRRVPDRILFTIPHGYRSEDHERARVLQGPDTTLWFTRLRQIDYRSLLPLARLNGQAREDAIHAVATDVAARSVRLTLDARLQQRAADIVRDIAARGQAAAAVVLDVDSGHVLARAQWPDYDPGQPETWLEPVMKGEPRFTGSYGPWKDKTGVGGPYQSGSIFKVYTALAWIRAGMGATDHGCGARGLDTFACVERDAQGPYFTRPGWSRAIHDSHSNTDGVIELTRALEVSCNVFFAQLGLALGPEPLRDLAVAGLEVDSGTDLDPGQAGSRRLASTAFGQGAARMHVSEAARMVAAVGAGGRYRKCPPTMLLGVPCTETALLDDPAATTPILAGLRQVVESGTARRLREPTGVRVYGKTGTATDPGRIDEVPYGLRRGANHQEHSWFVALAESATYRSCLPDSPGRLAFAVVVPRGGAGNGPALAITELLVAAAADLGYLANLQ